MNIFMHPLSKGTQLVTFNMYGLAAYTGHTDCVPLSREERQNSIN